VLSSVFIAIHTTVRKKEEGGRKVSDALIVQHRQKLKFEEGGLASATHRSNFGKKERKKKKKEAACQISVGKTIFSSVQGREGRRHRLQCPGSTGKESFQMEQHRLRPHVGPEEGKSRATGAKGDGYAGMQRVGVASTPRGQQREKKRKNDRTLKYKPGVQASRPRHHQGGRSFRPAEREKFQQVSTGKRKGEKEGRSNNPTVPRKKRLVRRGLTATCNDH